jgi:ABC-type nitrate/sulfonate/bicarbonate transport system substrate-binding protein
VSTAFVEKNPKTAQGIARALAKAHDVIEDEPATAKSVLIKYMPISLEVARNVGLSSYWDLEEIDKEAVRKLADLYAQTRVLPRKVETNGLYASFAPRDSQ